MTLFFHINLQDKGKVPRSGTNWWFVWFVWLVLICLADFFVCFVLVLFLVWFGLVWSGLFSSVFFCIGLFWFVLCYFQPVKEIEALLNFNPPAGFN
jgi:hypothetical protein